MTRNYRLMVAAALWGAFTGFGPSIVSIPTASAAGLTPQTSARSYFKKNAKASANKTPSLSFQQFMRLSRADQLDYLNLIKQTLVEMDRHPLERHASSVWDRSAVLAVQEALENLMFCSASAYGGSDDRYCLNQGVVIPIEGGANGQTCTVSPDLSMHNFDTRKVLSPLGDDALKCSNDPDGSNPNMKPCSPFFGFQADGSLYCSDKDSTPACDALSKGDKGTYLDALTKCGKGTPPPPSITIGTGKNPVSCSGLIQIYKEQGDIIMANCSEPQKFCSRVKKRVVELQHKVQAVEGLSDALNTIDQARAAVAGAGDAPKTDCGTTPPVTGPGSENAGGEHPAQPPSTANAAECPNKKDLSDVNGKADAFLGAIKEFLSKTGDSAPQCINFTLPGDRRLNLDKKGSDAGLWIEVKKDGKVSKVPFTLDDYVVLDSFWHHVDPAKTPLAALLDRTLPAAALVAEAHSLSKLDEKGFAVPAPCQKPTNAEMKQECDGDSQQLSEVQEVNLLLKGQPVPTRTWTAVDGTQFRFNTDQIPLKEKSPDGKPLGMTVLDIKGKNDTEEHGLFPIVQQMDDPAPGAAQTPVKK